MDGADLIRTERRRQVEEEGWTLEHDAHHTRGEMAWAAVCYAAPERIFLMKRHAEAVTWEHPWPKDWGRKKDGGTYDNGFTPPESARIRNLVKAGALIAAEIDRLLAEARRTA